MMICVTKHEIHSNPIVKEIYQTSQKPFEISILHRFFYVELSRELSASIENH